MPSEIQERRWKGLATNASPHDIPPGAALIQQNLAVVQPGVLRCRRGIQPFSYGSLTLSSGASIVGLCRFDTQLFSFVVYQDSNGVLRAACPTAGAPTMSYDFAVDYPFTAIRTREGLLLVANGIDRPFRWDGLNAPEIAGIDIQDSEPTVALGSGGGLSAGSYQWAYRYVDSQGYTSSLSPATTMTATAGQGATISGPYSEEPGNGPGGLRAVSVEVWRTTVAEKTTFYLLTTVPNTDSGWSYHDDTADSALYAEALADTSKALPVNNPDGSLNARRQGVPPCGKPFLALFQDRVFAYGVTTYSKGTVALVNGSASVTGTSTSWPISFQNLEFAGRTVRFGTDTVSYTILHAYGTTMTLSTNYAGTTASGVAYTVMPAPSDYRALCWCEQDEPESWPATNTASVQNNTLDNDAETGLMSFNSYIYLLHERHVYQATYVEQGTIIVTVQLVLSRGCFNNRLWVVTSTLAYLMDQFGAYAFDGQNAQPISDVIQDLWINNVLDFSTTDVWFASWEPTEQAVRFHVRFMGDSGTLPTRTLTWNTITQSWGVDVYPMGLVHATRLDVSGRNRLIVAATKALFLMSEGLTDIVTTAITGKATSGSTTTLTDTSANFSTIAAGTPVGILRGTGKLQLALVTSASTTTLTFGALSVAPAAGSCYAIGAISYEYQTGRHSLVGPEDVGAKRQTVVTYQPTAHECDINVQRLYDHDTVPPLWSPSARQPLGLVYENNGPNAVIRALSDQFPKGTDPGWRAVEYHGGTGGPLAQMWLAILLLGFQTQDAVTIYSLDLQGQVPE